MSGSPLQAVEGAIAGDDSKAARFAGATVSLNNVFSFAPGSDFSFEFWFKPDDPNAVVGVFSKHGAEPPLNLTVAGYYFTATKTQTTFTYDPPGGGLPPPTFKVNGPPPSTNAFTHVVVTSDGDSDLSIYVNGEGPTTTLVNPEATSVGLFLLGTSPDGAFRGALDEFAVYDKVLPAQLVRDHHATGRGTPARLPRPEALE
ncbi:MAG: LamG domain-containing protein [Polyangiaceae bacterium]|nr:LamG domain-containing protein [Polyangiaceae bacterium]